MNRFVRVVLGVLSALLAAFAFTVLMVAGAVGKSGLPTAVGTFCAFLIWPGLAITVDCLHDRVLGSAYFFPLILTFNTLIYSVIFGLLFWLFRTFRNKRQSQGARTSN